VTTTSGGPAADEIDQLKAKVQWLAEQHAATGQANLEADRDRWRVAAIEAQTALDQIGLDAQEVHGQPDQHHDANCWRQHAKCLADRITARIEGNE